METIHIERLIAGPVIQLKEAGLDPHDPDTINGPCVIKTPDWFENAKGKYYLYFSHHRGRRIELAYSDRIEGPWRIHEAGVIRMEETVFDHHIASPDVVIDNASQTVVMFLHGKKSDIRNQFSVRALSRDGIRFDCSQQSVGKPYYRVFRYQDKVFSLASQRGSVFLSVAEDIFSDFEEYQEMIGGYRHTALLQTENNLCMFYSKLGDCPERILCAPVHLTQTAKRWQVSLGEEIEILRPQFDWEGSRLPLVPSVPGPSINVHQVQDPYIFIEEGNGTFLFYTVAGESGIAVARLIYE